MDVKFHPAIAAIKSGDIEGLELLLDHDPALATTRSSKSHPTLLQCLALDARDVPNCVEMAKLLIDTGAEINGPLSACASCDNVEVAALLLNAGASINGIGAWSPLEEALYWGSNRVRDLLLERGASVHNLRIAAGLGRVDLIEGFFNPDGSLRPGAGEIHWPFEDPLTSNLPKPASERLRATIDGWAHNALNIINNAFVYACLHGHIQAASMLLRKGAEIDAIPPGFHYPGTGLHNAAVNGHRAMVEFLIEQGADANAEDQERGGSPAGWAAYGGYEELRDYLEGKASAQTQEKRKRRDR
jgi:ankyrin repeat protein